MTELELKCIVLSASKRKTIRKATLKEREFSNFKKGSSRHGNCKRNNILWILEKLYFLSDYTLEPRCHFIFKI